MKYKLIISILLLNVFYVSSQKKYHSAEINFVNNTKLIGWINDESIFDGTFEFKANEDSKSETFNISNIKNIYIYGKINYVYTEVNIDNNRKGINLSESYSFSEVKLIPNKLLLKYLVEGEKSLLYSEKNNISYYFTLVDNKFEYLIFNEYRSDQKIMKNETFKNQLLSILKCESSELQSYIRSIKYHKNDIINAFKKYYSCKNDKNVSFDSSQKKGNFGISIYGGVKYYYVKFPKNGFMFTDISDNYLSPAIGFEINYDINNFDVLSRLTLSSVEIKNSKTTSLGGVGTGYSYIDFNSKIIDLNLGIRRNFFRNNGNIYLDLLLEFSILNDAKTSTASLINQSEFPQDNLFYSHDSKNGIGLNFGFGYFFNKKIGLEIRYSINKDHHLRKTIFYSNFSNLGINFIYHLK